MPTYAGVALAQPTPELAAIVAERIPLADIVQFTPSPRVSKLVINWPTADENRLAKVKLGTLYWPTGASRWAVGCFLATESQLTAIRGNGATYAARPFILDDATSSITTNLWMLPPRPLFQDPDKAGAAVGTAYAKWILPKTDFASSGEPVYLLCLVDDRYFWWQKQSAISIVEGTTTWAQFIAAVASALGVTITVDAIASAYLKPPAEIASYNEYLPPLLDLALWSIGQRFVRKLDGTCLTQGPVTARAAMQAQVASFDRLAGGQFAFDAS